MIINWFNFCIKGFMNLKYTLPVLFFATISFGQADGYWDKDRITSKQIVVEARQSIVIKSEDFPVGTTEIIYRITSLNENQELSSSLVSLLKAVPDPTGISQGSAGAIFLMSKLAGSDKCTYAVFNAETKAVPYTKNGDTSKACLIQSAGISKDAKLLTINKNSCLTENMSNLWFGFESKNLILNQKIILEIVPWVNNKLARGWNATNKKIVLGQQKKLTLDVQPINKDYWHLAILDKIQDSYTFVDFMQLETLEKTKICNDVANQILTAATPNTTILKSFRADVTEFAKQGKYDQAIALLENGLLIKNQSNAADLNLLGSCYLFTKQFQKALQTLTKGENIDPASLSIQLNLAHTYLLLGEYNKAKNIHKKYQNQNINTTISWKNKFRQDVLDFQKAGIVNDDFERILKKIED